MMTRTFKNLFLLRDTFDDLLCSVAPSVTAFTREAKINHSTVVYARQRGHVRQATAERIAQHYASCAKVPAEQALELLFLPYSPARQQLAQRIAHRNQSPRGQSTSVLV